MKVYVVSTSNTGEGVDFIRSIHADRDAAEKARDALESWPEPSVAEWEVLEAPAIKARAFGDVTMSIGGRAITDGDALTSVIVEAPMDAIEKSAAETFRRHERAVLAADEMLAMLCAEDGPQWADGPSFHWLERRATLLARIDGPAKEGRE